MYGINREPENILAAPYRRGQLGKPKHAHLLFQAILGLIFVSIPLTHIALTYVGNSAIYVPFGIIYLLVFLLSLWLESYGRPRFSLIGIDVLLFAATIVGVVGLYEYPFTQIVQVSVGYTLFLLLRNFLLFTLIPRTTVLSLEDMVKYTEKWAYLAALLTTVISAAFAHWQGFGFTGNRFFVDNWLHPNLVSMYCAVLLLLSIISKNVKKQAKVIGILASVYTLLLMQSRGAILAVAVGFFAYLVITANAQRAKALIAGLFIVLAGYFAAPLVLPTLTEFSPIAIMVERSTNVDDPTSGRIERFNYAMERAAENPIFGTGYKTTFPVDNFIAYYVQEVGLVGLFLYIAFAVILLWYSFRLFRYSTDATVRYIAKTSLILNTFVITRAFVESTNLMEISDLMSNMTFFFGGLLIAGSNTVPLNKRILRPGILATAFQYRTPPATQLESSKESQ